MNGTIIVRCCRDWEVPVTGWGECGLCHRRPEVVAPVLPEDPKLMNLTY